ncbi:hypothetical protein Tsubulata_045218 [Turnera subulata]|uniref:ADP-ribosyl cyclase/cyclic ADP-ribose hydrolase n=1 Tax=Turnera subulata TaxID=218843 RepID=A0A9Q0FS31_9ROSI|nr:hypothetical protein Tsubulata_045218 [Turnera subulata]
MLSVAAHPVGLNSRANHVISLVADESVDVGMVGIYGMGGIGKTTIAKEVYNSIFRNFDGCCFLENGTKAVEGIILNNPGLRQLFSAKTFKKMKRLRLLQLNYVRLTGSCEYISSKLRWICWRKFPYDSIPSDLNLENLVALEMRYGNMEQFFEEENVRLLRYKSISVAYQFRKVYTYVILILQYLLQSLKKLKFINLNHSHQLKRTPNFEGFTSLEELMLKDCICLEEIDESIGLATSLRILNLQDCKNLKHLPGSICGLRSLLKLNISGCNKLEDLPEELGNLQSLVTLTADETPISTLPETISSLENLQHLSLRGCHSVFSLEKNTPIINFLPSSLKELDLRYCNIVDSMIPDDLRGLPLLQNFKLCGNNFTSLPASVCGLPMLYSLWLNECKRLRSIPQLPSSVNQLQADNCPSLVSIDLTNVHGASAFQFSGCRSLHEIKGFFNFESLRPEVVGALLKNGLSAQELIANSSETLMIDNLTATYRSSSLQALCERGTYSIFLPGNEIPIWFGHQSEGDTVSFHVPPLDHEEGSKIVGIVTCCIYSWRRPSQSCYFFPDVTIINKTKMFHWVYTPYVTFLSKDVEQDIMWVCYWSFDHLEPGVDEVDMNWRFKNELEQGDLLEFSVDMGFGIVPKRCGVHLLYHQEDLAVIRGSSTHRRRFLRSIPRWLTMENPQEITPEMWKNSSGNEEFSLWSKRREQRVNKTPDYDRTYKTGFPY